RQGDTRLHGDAITLDLEHAVHRGKVELRAAVGRDATRHRAARADGAHGARITPHVHQYLLNLARRRHLDGRRGAGGGRGGDQGALTRDGGVHERTDSLHSVPPVLTEGVPRVRKTLECPATPLSWSPKAR